MQPTLALFYSSGADNGNAGVGWGLPGLGPSATSGLQSLDVERLRAEFGLPEDRGAVPPRG